METDITRLRYVRSLKHLQLFWNLRTSTHIQSTVKSQKHLTSKQTWDIFIHIPQNDPTRLFQRNFNSIRILQRDIGIYLWLHSADLVTQDLWRPASNSDETVLAGGLGSSGSGGFDSNFPEPTSSVLGCWLFTVSFCLGGLHNSWFVCIANKQMLRSPIRTMRCRISTLLTEMVVAKMSLAEPHSMGVCFFWVYGLWFWNPPKLFRSTVALRLIEVTFEMP